MLQPKRTKFRKAHKGRIRGNAKGGTTLTFGSFGLKATSPSCYYPSHETCRSCLDPRLS
jgi:ribosomal protein L16/L10AE